MPTGKKQNDIKKRDTADGNAVTVSRAQKPNALDQVAGTQ